MEEKKKKFISYMEDNDEIVKGYFEVVETNSNFIKFKSGTNEITMPWNRILKLKENSKNCKEVRYKND